MSHAMDRTALTSRADGWASSISPLATVGPLTALLARSACRRQVRALDAGSITTAMNAYRAAPDLPTLRAPEWTRLHPALGAGAADPRGRLARAEQLDNGAAP